MKHLGGLAGTLMAILALTWAIQGDSFFLVGMLERATDRVRRAIAGPPSARLPDQADAQPIGDGTAAAPVAAQLDAVATVPNPSPRSGPAPVASAPRPPLATTTLDPPGAAPPVAASIAPRSDGRTRMITVTRNGPIVARPGRSDQPALLVATEGMGLKLLDIEGEWFKVEFNDPKRGGARVGYIQLQYVQGQPEEMRVSGRRRAPTRSRRRPPSSRGPRSAAR